MAPYAVFGATLAALAMLTSAVSGHAATLESDQLKAKLVAEQVVVAPGEMVSILLHQTIAPGWHTYWRNPGDSGLAPAIDWQVPDGVTVTSSAWPAPHRIEYGPLVNFGFSDETALLFDVTVPAGWPAGLPVPIRAEAEILVCEKICIPVSGRLALDIPTGARGLRDPDTAARFAAARAQQPLAALWPAAVHTGPHSLTVRLQGPASDFGAVERAFLFPLEWGLIKPAAPQRLSITGDGLALTASLGEVLPPTTFSGVVTLFPKDGPSRAFMVTNAPVTAGSAPLSPTAESAPDLNLALLLVLAFAGGMLLNLMPCVFPVLAVKAVGLASQADRPTRDRLAHGGAYTMGVLVSFLALAVLLLGLRAGGMAVGWGFQLQEPLIVGFLAYVVAAVGLNLSGLFEIGGGLSRLGGSVAIGSGHLGSFATGLLATLVAAPCTAPFMATAIGGALLLPPVLTLLVFAALALGLAFPYLALSGMPALARWIPKPGAWMVRFKQVLAFPMYATAAWLIWVLSRQAGPDAAFLVTLGLIALAFAAWALPDGPMAARGMLRTAARAALVVLPLAAAAGALVWIAGSGSHTAKIQTVADAAEPFSADRLAALERAGQPVFVNITADWCITCKVNERVALSGDRFTGLLECGKITYLQGDWTNHDVEITRFLERFQRIGVPLYVYFPGAGREPVVLPQVLTPGLLDEALSGKGTEQT